MVARNGYHFFFSVAKMFQVVAIEENSNNIVAINNAFDIVLLICPNEVLLKLCKKAIYYCLTVPYMKEKCLEMTAFAVVNWYSTPA